MTALWTCFIDTPTHAHTYLLSTVQCRYCIILLLGHILYGVYIIYILNIHELWLCMRKGESKNVPSYERTAFAAAQRINKVRTMCQVSLCSVWNELKISAVVNNIILVAKIRTLGW